MAGDFAAKILWLLDRPEERKRMGEIGRKRVEAELAWKFSVGNLLAAYERALPRRVPSFSAYEPAESTRDI
jgi:glycosyltransferase involved in cell wall biosynthesis